MIRYIQKRWDSHLLACDNIVDKEVKLDHRTKLRSVLITGKIYRLDICLGANVGKPNILANNDRPYATGVSPAQDECNEQYERKSHQIQ